MCLSSAAYGKNRIPSNTRAMTACILNGGYGPQVSLQPGGYGVTHGDTHAQRHRYVDTHTHADAHAHTYVQHTHTNA